MTQCPIQVTQGRMGKFSQFIGLLWMTSHVLCFNLEPQYVQSYKYPYTSTQGKDSYFGFSVALLHNETNNDNWLIVGAPRANSSYHDEAEIPEPGALFKCSLSESTCQEIVVDRTGNDKPLDERHRYKDEKNYGWLGGSLDSQPSYKSHRQATCVCAPQWKDSEWKTGSYMNGACYIGLHPISNDPNFMKKIPLVDRKNQKKGSLLKNAYGQAGFSLHFPDDSTSMIIGAPGFYNWTGTILLFEDEVQEDTNNVRRKRDTLSQEGIFMHSDVHKTDAVEEGSLLGYSVTSGNFLQQDEIHYAAGAPHALNSVGKVIVFGFPLDGVYFLVKKEFEGEQIGEYFGGAITAADVNGDGLDDLIVASPLYTSTHNINLHDIGKIYTFISKKGSGLSKNSAKHFGQSRLARFGTSLASLGDLNHDTYEDIAVGAPWEGSGKVYIFMGSQNGLKEQWSQCLSQEDFTPLSLKGFGMSFSRGIDIDNNGYPDVAIGSFLSGHALVVRSRPVARLSGTVTIKPPSVAWDKEANVDLETCIRYEGHRLPENMSIQARLILDYGSHMVRAVFSDKNNTHSFTEKLNNDKHTCRKHQVTVKKDKIHPDYRIIMRLEYDIKENQDLQLIERPMTDPAANNYSVGYVSIAKECKDKKCKVDLKTKATLTDTNNYAVRGKVNRLRVEVTNTGEPAYFPNLTVTVDPPLTLKLLTLGNCMIVSDEQSLVTCNLSNPIKKNNLPDVVDVGVEVNEQQLMNNTRQVKLHVNVNGEGEEVRPGDNILNMTLQVATQANITLQGFSEEEQVLYKLTEEETSILTKKGRFNHTYILNKNGPTNLESISLVIDIPVNFSDGTQLIKVYGWKDKFSNQVNCHLYGAKWSEDSKMGMSSTDNEIVTSSDRNTPYSSHTHGGVDDMDDFYFNCSSSFIKCAHLYCHLPNWTVDSESAMISVQLGIDLHILEKHISILDGAIFSSRATATIQSLNPLRKFIGNNMTIGETVMRIQPDNLQSKGIPWWAIVLALLGSLLLLGLVTYALHKKGFFKREKKEELKSKQARLERAPTDGVANTLITYD